MTKLPLEGLRILDISYMFSLPYAGGLLSDLGAEVIKIEGPGRVDGTRQGDFSGIHPDNIPGPDPWNRTSTYNLLNRGKKSLALDLGTPEGREVLKDLIKVSDILMENFTPRVMRKWGLDYPNAKKLKEDIIMVSCSGYGHNGPYSLYPAQATSQEATHGLAHITGYRDGIPSKAGQSYTDFPAGWACFAGALLGLRHRRRTGKGLWLDIAMYQMGCYNVGEYILDWVANGRIPERIGNRHPWYAPQGAYACAGEDQWCVLSVRDDEEWAALCGVMGVPELATDTRFLRNEDRIAHHDAIDAIISAWTKDLDKQAVTERLQEAGVPAGPVLDLREVNMDRHVKARGFLEKVQYPPARDMGTRTIIGRPWRLSGMPISVRSHAPTLGEHNRDVIQGILGYGDEQYAELERAGTIGTVPTKARKLAYLEMDERVRQGRLAYWDPDYREKLGLPD